ncbi:MAG: HAMP domain-containing protein [Cyanobium sp.]
MDKVTPDMTIPTSLRYQNRWRPSSESRSPPNSLISEILAKLLNHAHQTGRSLRFRIAISAIAAVAASSLVADTIIYITTAQQVRQRAENTLVRINYLLAFAADHWRGEIFKSLELLTINASFQELNLTEIDELLKKLRIKDPNRRIAVWSPQGRLLVGDADSTRGMVDLHVFQNPAFQEALKGNRTLQVLPPDRDEEGCVFAAGPIPGPGPAAGSRDHPTPRAILTFCLPFFLAEDTQSLSADIEKTDQPGEGGARNQDLISMQKGKYSGSEFMMVRRNGHVIFPLTAANDVISKQSAEQIRQGPWGPFVQLALSNQPDDIGLELRTRGQRFLVVKRSLPDRSWVVLSIVNRETAFRGLNAALDKLRLLQLATLGIVALVLYRVSGGIVKPIRQASAAIRRISKGDFSTQISHQRQDELGDLYDDINATGSLLSSYVSSEKNRAAAEQQLATAQQIQQSFLTKTAADIGML